MRLVRWPSQLQEVEDRQEQLLLPVVEVLFAAGIGDAVGFSLLEVQCDA
jgi:hypothetical protein